MGAYAGPVRIVQWAVSFFLAHANRGPGKSRKVKSSTVFAGFSARQFLFPFKLLMRVADNSFVQRSALITGLSLALCGVTLAAIGEWAAGRLDGSAADPGPSVAAASPSGYVGGIIPPFRPKPPSLPEAGDHLPAKAPGYTVQHDVPEVRLQFTVADQQGRLVENLSPTDVRVLDDQTPVAAFTDFERDQNLPLRLGLLLDTSASVKRVLPNEKAAAISFIGHVMRADVDRTFLMGFSGDIHVWQSSTANREALIDAIDRLKQPGWGTRFFDALYSACADQLVAHDQTSLTHRALVVLSDGDDTDSFHSLSDVVGVAQRNEIQIYALTLHSRKLKDRGDLVLQQLTEATGGRLYVAQSSQELDAAFTQIEQDLRTQYYVSFSPQRAKPGFHSLRVEVRTSPNAEIHARQGYYAVAQQPVSASAQ